MYAEQVTLALWLGILDLGLVAEAPTRPVPASPSSDILP